MNIFELTRVDDGTPAATLRRGVIVVEPGDATHYELRVDRDKRIAVGVVGAIDDGDASGIVALAFDTRGMVVHPFGDYAKRNDPTAQYTKEVLAFFCALALGEPCREPDYLAARRRRG